MLTIKPDVEETAFSLDTVDGTRVTIIETPHLDATKFHVRVTRPGGATLPLGRIVRVDGEVGFYPNKAELMPIRHETLTAISSLVQFAEDRMNRL